MAQEKHEKEEDVGELFLVRLEKNDLQKLGFDASVVERIKHVYVYLVWEGDIFSVKFIWHGVETLAYTLNVNKIPKWIFSYIIDKYIES